jgi:hypothetical protein
VSGLSLVQPNAVGAHPLIPELRRVVIEAARRAPRSLQAQLGASEYGIECSRRLAYKLFAYPEINENDGWYSTLGTALHTYLGEALRADGPRWLTDVRVRSPVLGTLDAFDTQTNTLIDFKLTGKTSLVKYRRHGPGEQYRTQVHLYGDGMAELGAQVEHVAIAFFGRCDSLDALHVWSEPYDPAVGRAARQRLATITELGVALDLENHPERVRQIPTADSFCNFCPWFSRSDAGGCPGHAPTKESSEH